MSFRFEVDDLADLDPALIHLERLGVADTLDEIEECKLAGTTGGEILSCVCASLRRARRKQLDAAADAAIAEYLRRAGPGC